MKNKDEIDLKKLSEPEKIKISFTEFQKFKENQKELEQVTEQIKEKKKQHEKELESLKTKKQNLEENIKNQKDKLSDAAISYYRDTNDKSFIHGIKIQNIKTIDLFDKQKAFNYALDHKMFLKLDEKNLENAIKKQTCDYSEVRNFAELKNDLRVTFPTKIEN